MCGRVCGRHRYTWWGTWWAHGYAWFAAVQCGVGWWGVVLWGVVWGGVGWGGVGWGGVGWGGVGWGGVGWGGVGWGGVGCGGVGWGVVWWGGVGCGVVWWGGVGCEAGGTARPGTGAYGGVRTLRDVLHWGNRWGRGRGDGPVGYTVGPCKGRRCVGCRAHTGTARYPGRLVPGGRRHLFRRSRGCLAPFYGRLRACARECHALMSTGMGHGWGHRHRPGVCGGKCSEHVRRVPLLLPTPDLSAGSRCTPGTLGTLRSPPTYPLCHEEGDAVGTIHFGGGGGGGCKTSDGPCNAWWVWLSPVAPPQDPNRSMCHLGLGYFEE